MKALPVSIQGIIKYQLIILVGILIILEGLLIWHLYYISHIKIETTPKNNNYRILNQAKQVNKQTNNCQQHINGMVCQTGKDNLYPVAVSIDNQYEAWPNYGLSQAKLVYETLVEGGVTRFLAFFTPDTEDDLKLSVEKIGPVRSVRPYLVTIAKEYNALLAHAGGSPQALKLIKEIALPNLEEIAWWGPDYFWRVYSRQAPHNLFTSSKKLSQALIDWELSKNKPTYRPWLFSSQRQLTNYPLVKKIKIFFSDNPLYNVNYTYSTTTKTYFRRQGKQKHIDALTNQQIETKNVVIQWIPKEKILDNKGRLKLNLIGTGRALIFINGKEIKGKWEKHNIETRTIFYDSNNNEIEFKPGNIWVEIVPVDKEVKVE